jgi:hypothetical protein
MWCRIILDRYQNQEAVPSGIYQKGVEECEELHKSLVVEIAHSKWPDPIKPALALKLDKWLGDYYTATK